MKNVVETVYSLNSGLLAGTANERLNNREWRGREAVYSLNIKRETVERVYIGGSPP
jgi:hypothetical protein